MAEAAISADGAVSTASAGVASNLLIPAVGARVPFVPTLPVLPPNEAPVRLPREYFTKKFPDERPMVMKRVDASLFRDEHRFMLSQLLRADMSRIVDIGAGLGASTLFFAESVPGAKVFAVDLWHQLYCVETLAGSLCPPDVVDVYRELPSGFFETFCANVWEAKERILPYKFPAWGALKALINMSVTPQLIYIDADLQYERLKELFAALYARYGVVPQVMRGRAAVHLLLCAGSELLPGLPPNQDVILAGGGWDLSDGVKRAVQETAAMHALDLHVERGTLCATRLRHVDLACTLWRCSPT